MIPDKFRKDTDETDAYTVGELKELLKELPDDLEILQGFVDGCRVVVLNDVNNERDVIRFDELWADEDGYAEEDDDA